MMKKFLFIAALFTSLAACKSKTDAALKYNQDFVAKDNNLQSEEQVIEDKVGNFYNERMYDSIAAAGEHMEVVLQKAIDEIDAKPVPKAKGIEQFKEAVLKYFRFRKSIYTVYKEYGQAGTDEKREEIETIRNKLVAQRDDVASDMQNTQSIFSKANGFRMK
jgi:ABC-type Fe3+-hydroxamate transport system substrate-binding protein